jgi:hypothetical protein
MANWINLRLLATGAPADLERFQRAAGARSGRIKSRRSTVFISEMEYGEGRDLEADGVSRFRGRFRTALYLFQGRNDDHAGHFRQVSRRFPELAFVLVYSDPNGDSHGSYLLTDGDSRMWEVPRQTRRTILKRHYAASGVVDRRGRIDYDAPEADEAEWESFWEFMDVAQEKWDEHVFRWVTRQKKRESESR